MNLKVFHILNWTHFTENDFKIRAYRIQNTEYRIQITEYKYRIQNHSENERTSAIPISRPIVGT